MNLKFQELTDKLAELKPVVVHTLNDAVYEALRNHILDQRFEPGERLNLPALETQLQVSRTPLQSALTRLQNEGLVEILPRRGTFIAKIDVERIEENFKIRSAFELYVSLCLFKYLEPEDMLQIREIHAEMCELHSMADPTWSNVAEDYLKLDYQLHELLVTRGGPPVMVKLFQQTLVHSQLTRLIPKFAPKHFLATHAEHERIFDAIEAYSPDQLHASLLDHLEASRGRVMRVLRRDDDKGQPASN
jgi:GntR family transcriptional regulator, rspAB operon transcriptional repressor